MLFVAEVLNFGFWAPGSCGCWTIGEAAVESAGLDDGEVGDWTAVVVTIGVLEVELTFVSSFEGDLMPRLIGGGVAPSESSEATVLGDDRVVPSS